MSLKKEKIIVIGAGAWGTALSDLIARNSYEVLLIANDKKIISEINYQNTNQKFLPQINLNKKVIAQENFEREIKNANLVFIVIPSANAAQIFQKISKLKINKKCGFVICSKGLEQNSLMLLSDAFEKITKIKNYAVLSGPNFALEVANQFPTVTSIASRNKKLAVKIIKVLNNNHFHAQYFKDPRNVEICGIIKNIIAIGCGIIDGLDLGVNMKAALVTKGIAEIQLLCKKLNASSDLASAAGFGDIFLTCSSLKSRNNSLGSAIANGQSYQEIIAKTKTTYEGAISAKSVTALAKKLKLQLSLCETINEIIVKGLPPKEIKEKIIKAILQ